MHEILIIFIRLRTLNSGHAHDYRINEVSDSDENFVFTAISITEYGEPPTNASRIREWVWDQKCGGEYFNCGFSAIVIHFDETQGLLANALSF